MPVDLDTTEQPIAEDYQPSGPVNVIGIHENCGGEVVYEHLAAQITQRRCLKCGQTGWLRTVRGKVTEGEGDKP